MPLKNHIERDAKKGTLGFFSPLTDLFGVTMKPSFSLACLPGSVRENKEKDILLMKMMTDKMCLKARNALTSGAAGSLGWDSEGSSEIPNLRDG